MSELNSLEYNQAELYAWQPDQTGHISDTQILYYLRLSLTVDETRLSLGPWGFPTDGSMYVHIICIPTYSVILRLETTLVMPIKNSPYNRVNTAVLYSILLCTYSACKNYFTEINSWYIPVTGYRHYASKRRRSNVPQMLGSYIVIIGASTAPLPGEYSTYTYTYICT